MSTLFSTLGAYAQGVLRVTKFFANSVQAAFTPDESITKFYNFLEIPQWTDNKYLDCGRYVYAFRPWKATLLKYKTIFFM